MYKRKTSRYHLSPLQEQYKNKTKTKLRRFCYVSDDHLFHKLDFKKILSHTSQVIMPLKRNGLLTVQENEKSVE